MAHAEEIYIDQSGSLTRVAYLTGGRVSDLLYELVGDEAGVGAIYRGKVTRVMGSMQAAFIDIGLPQKGFLHARDVVRPGAGDLKVEQLLHEGQMVLVQVSKAARVSATSVKGAVLSTEISLTDSLLVYLPTAKNSADVVLSKQIADEPRALKLRDELSQTMTDQGLRGRLIVRSEVVRSEVVLSDAGSDVVNNSTKTTATVRQSLQNLVTRWRAIESAAQKTTTPALVAPEQNLLIRTLQQLSPQLNKIWLGDPLTQAQVHAELAKTDLDKDQRIQFADIASTEKKQALVNQAEQAALSRTLTLPSGGSVVFDTTEALTVIDVNTGNADMGSETYHQTNLEAVQEIALQLRLRNIGGIVVVDFINTQRSSDRAKLLKVLTASLSKDPVTTRCEASSPLGLVEITRARKTPSIAEYFSAPCTHCAGQGRVKTAQTVGREIVTQLNSRGHLAKAITISAAPAVVAALQGEHAQALKRLQSEAAFEIALEADEDRDFANYNIVLGQ